jgi:signal peptidase I
VKTNLKWEMGRGKGLLLKIFKNGVLLLVIAVFIPIALKIFLIDFFQIPSRSMEPELLSGDIILVSKMRYGPRIIDPIKFAIYNKIETIRIKGWDHIRKGDIIVFNMPQYDYFPVSSVNGLGDFTIKRCYALPGDSVIIRRDRNIVCPAYRNLLFPYDSCLNWSLGDYGPLYIPAKDEIMELTKKNVIWYKEILRYENTKVQIKDSLLIKDGKIEKQYRFNSNYYFLLGDNFYSSYDSRYWGFVPEDNIIGKAVMVFFSVDPNKVGLKKIRWNRLFKTL